MQLLEDKGIIKAVKDHNVFAEKNYWKQENHINIDDDELNDLL